MSKKVAKTISVKTGASLFEALEFIRAEMRCHEARVSGVPEQRAQARNALKEARLAWTAGTPLALPVVGRSERYITPVGFFVRSWGGKRPKISQSSQRDCEERQRARVGLLPYDANFEVSEEA